MITPQGKQGDLLPHELRSILATVFMLPADDIEDWLIIVKKQCVNCGRKFCGDGELATVSSRSAVATDGAIWHEPEFELHLTSKLIDALAAQWRMEREPKP